MEYYQGYRGMIRGAIFLVFFLCTSYAFIQDSRITEPPHEALCQRRPCGMNVSKSQIRFLPKRKENEPTTEATGRDNANCFGSISTRIYMVGPLSKDEDSVLVGESVKSSPGGARGMPGMAHGVLCPETVSKMELATQGGRSNRAVKAFLDRYHKCGPMSCMELLSDPEILHHLTTTMRDLA